MTSTVPFPWTPEVVLIFCKKYTVSQFLACLKGTSVRRAVVVTLGQVVQSIVSLTSSLRGQLVKCFTTL